MVEFHLQMAEPLFEVAKKLFGQNFTSKSRRFSQVFSIFVSRLSWMFSCKQIFIPDTRTSDFWLWKFKKKQPLWWVGQQKKLKFWWNKITHYLPTQKKHDVCVAPSTLDFGTNFQAGRMGNSANSRLVNQWVGCDKVWSGNEFCLWVLKDKVLVMIYGIIFYVWRFT